VGRGWLSKAYSKVSGYAYDFQTAFRQSLFVCFRRRRKSGSIFDRRSGSIFDCHFQLIEERPDAYLDELSVELNVSAFTIAYGLQRLGISRKKNHVVRGANRGRTQQI
jgi:hypothetical protein